MENTILDSSAEDISNPVKPKPLMYVLKYGAILFTGYALQWLTQWLLRRADIEPGIERLVIQISTYLMLALHFVVVIRGLRKFYRSYPGTGILKMTGIGSSICFVAVFSFALVRMPFFSVGSPGDEVLFFIIIVSLFTGLGSLIAFFTAFQLKTKDTGWLILMIVGTLIILGILVQFIPGFK